MSRRKLEKKNIRKLFKTAGGRSMGLILPISFIRDLKWKAKQKVVVEYDKRRKRLIISDWEKKRK